MKCKNAKIVIEGKEVATIICSEDGLHIKPTKEGKQLLKECCPDCC